MTRVTLLAISAVLGVALAGCSGGGADTTGATETTPPPTTQPAPTPPPPPTTTTEKPEAPAATTVRIVVKDGKAVGGLQRTTVDKGTKVVLVVTSDAAGAMHLHGYDKAVATTPGVTARLAVVASLPGRFEIEFHGNRHFQVADLEVRP